MTIDRLREIVVKNNREQFQRLTGSDQAWSDEYASNTVNPGDQAEYDGCFCGQTSKGYTSAGDLNRRCVILSAPSKGRAGKVFSGSTIDDQTQTAVESLPVVVVIGINYGQGTEYLSSRVPLMDKTGMRPKLMKVFAELAPRCENQLILDSGFHLIAANFFPWITTTSWGSYKFNSIEEMAIVRCLGHADPTQHLRDLLTACEEDLTAVVFHGANNAVPYLGSELLNRHGTKGFQAIFCDNLAGSQNPRVSNAISLCSHKWKRLGREDLASVPFDE